MKQPIYQMTAETLAVGVQIIATNDSMRRCHKMRCFILNAKLQTKAVRY
jgi:hypothetical protein